MKAYSCRPVKRNLGATGPVSAAARSGFTLVELLVAMGIFVILAGIAISSFRATTDDDRIAAAAQQIKSSINGAQSRALRDKAIRGVRFLRDPNNPTQCRSLQYIGAVSNDEGFVDVTLGIHKSVEYYTAFSLDGSAANTVRQLVVPIGETVATWRNLAQAGKIQPGNRIQIPKGGRYYTITSVQWMNLGLTPTDPNQIFGVVISEPLAYESDGNTWQFLPAYGGVGAFPFGAPTRPPGSNFGMQLPAAPIDVPNYDYSLELEVGPLPDEQPIALPKGTVIDLDGSEIPSVWRPFDGFNGNPVDSQITLPEYPNCDLMFSSTGKVIGTPASAGMIHFYIGNLEEVDKYNQARFDAGMSARRPVLSIGPLANIPDVPGDDTSTGVDETQKKPARWVTLLTASGQTYSSDIDATILPPAATAAQIAARRLKFAKRGEEAGR